MNMMAKSMMRQKNLLDGIILDLMKVMQVIKPTSIKKLNNGKYVLDMGQNFAGWLQIKVQGKRGQKVQLRFAESLKSDGEIFTANLRDAKVTDIYTLKGVE